MELVFEIIIGRLNLRLQVKYIVDFVLIIDKVYY